MKDAASDSVATERLLDRASAGDVHAFGLLFDRHRDYLCAVIARRLDPRVRQRVDASDVIQETQLEAFDRLADYLRRRPMPFGLWLLKTAHERLLKIHRFHMAAERRSVRREVSLPDRSSLQLAQQLAASGLTASQHMSRREVAQRVREVLSELTEIDREIVLFRNFEGLSNSDVAAILDIEPDAAKKRYTRALIRLHRLMTERGLRSSQL
jgi:RNA polymerase sigma-70 factor (ECF subfamily)